ncbi:receptor-type tyrosine-protein phosphatase eta isoform X1 [Heterodontus francisci]|uniref:receptor-type tyrosine-protein phosphatase eta isoform X1 n=1 Tax=Heterodontus francisci TaxID=7792 RepID=UPI00355C4A80
MLNDLFSSLTFLGIITADFVAKPGDIVVMHITSTSISLNWSRPEGMNNTSYNFSITYSSSNGQDSITETTNFTTITGLHPGTNYTIAVVTVVNGTKSDPVIKSVFTLPSKPGAIIVTSFTNSSISLSLGKPTGMNVTQYNFSVMYSSSNGNSSFIVPTNSTTITDLDSGTNYTITVTTIVPGDVKSEAVVINQFTKPNHVTKVTLLNRTTTSVTLSWSRPFNHKPEYRYRVETTGIPPSNKTVANESVTVAQLNPGTEYTFNVLTLAADDTSAEPATVSFTTVPSKPGAIIVTSFTNSSISLSLGKPTGMNVTQYNFSVMYSSSNGNSSFIVPTSSTTITDLDSGTNYTITVTTIVPGDVKSEAVVINQFTKPNHVTKVTLLNRTTTSVTLSWSRPFNHKPEYRYRVETTGIPPSNKTVANESVTVAQLNPGTEYTFNVLTLAADDTSAEPATVSFTTVPSKPGAIIVTSFTNSSISLSLGKPTGMNVTQYNFSVMYSSSNGNSSFIVPTNSTTITDLDSGTNYTITVTTIVPGDVKSEAVVINQFTKPNEVLNVNVVNVSTDFVTLNWTRPPDHKDGYQYMVLTEGNPAPIGGDGNITVRNDTATINGLTSGTKYNFTITTLAADGTRADSVMHSSYTKPVQIPQENITVDNNGTVDTLIVSWSPPPGKVEKFFVVILDVNSSETQVDSTDSTSPITFTNLRPGRKYSITVITNSGPFNVTSDSVQGITGPNIPGSINVTNFSTNSISLNWGEPADMDVGSYTFNVTYHDDSIAKSVSVNINSTTISNLTSGTNYTISVATVGPGSLQSDFVSIAHFTKPNPVTNIQVVNVGTNSITLNWTQPIEYRNEYSYMVMTKESSASTSDNGNVTVKYENITVGDLIPGINYTFTVITLAADGTPAKPVITSSYTKPVQIPQENITVDNNGTVDTLIVSWSPPPGKVEKFFVVILDVNSSERQDGSTDSTLTITFTNLRPGREYSITVITNSGPFNVTSDSVQGITVPNIPGSISVTNFSTSSISLNWGAPKDMDVGTYTFNITYSDGSSTNSIMANTNFTTISNLTSGTEYTISVATIGPGQLHSDFVLINHFTKPNPIKSPQIVQIDTTSITLSWARPDQYKAEYRYRVLTDGSPAPTGNNGNQTVTNENVTMMGLTPGTNYTFSIITLANDGTKADPVAVANYTEPVKIPLENMSLSNQGTTDSLTISWIRPPGGVESFTIDIEDSLNPTAYKNSTTVSSSSNNTAFHSLRPGRLYSVTVTTISGPHHITSDSISKATIPSPPGSIVVTDVTNSTIEFRWGRPENMDIGGYNFSVAYQVAQTTNVITKVVEDNKSTIFDLDSGSNYTITVITTIPQNLNSSSVTKSLYTRPNPISNLRVVSSNTTSMHLTWDQPLGYKSEYKYRVQIDGKPQSNLTVDVSSIIVSGLTSGDKFTFTVFTQTADNTEGNSVTLVQCTDAAAISSSSLTCKGVDLNPIINFEWTCPSGVNTGFQIKAISSTRVLTKNITKCTSGEHQFNLTNVKFFTSYSVNITTLSCGKPSTPTRIDCKSGITRPSQPSTKLDLSGFDFTHKTIKFGINKNAFNSNNGPIVAIAVIVTKEQSDNIPNGKTIETAFDPAVSAYVTLVIDLQDATQNTRADALASPISVDIGSNSKSHGYVNKELSPLTTYRLSLAGFTKVAFDAQDKIDSEGSFYSAYNYSEKITLKQNPDVIIGAVVGTILGVVVILLLLLLLIWWKKRTKSNNKDLTQLPIPNMR